MKTATQERYNEARRALSKGCQVWIRLAGDVKERRIYSLSKTQHNLHATFDKDGKRWTVFEPDELVGVLMVDTDG